MPARPVSLAAVALVAIFALGLGAGCKVDAQKCDQACRNVAKLLYWEQSDKEIIAAPADQRDALRKRKLGEFSKKLEEGIDLCNNQCQSARPDVDCMIASTKADEARACIEK
jgi:hypothetical protein